MKFRIVASLTAGICMILFVILLVLPDTYVSTYGVTPDAGSGFMVRRASPMFGGFALMLWLARNAPPSQVRMALAYGVAVSFAGVALTGVFAFATGTAGPMILAAAFGETLIAGLLVSASRAR